MRIAVSRQRRRRRLLRWTARGGRRGRHLPRARRASRGDAHARAAHPEPEGQRPHHRNTKADRRPVGDRAGRHRLFRRQALRHRAGDRDAAAAHRPRHRRHPAPERRRQRRAADRRRRAAARRRRHVLRLRGHRRAGRDPAHGDGPPVLRRARRPPHAADGGAARGVPAGRIPVDAQQRHQRRHLDQVRAPVGLERPDRP